MKKPFVLVLLALMVASAGYLLTKFDVIGLDGIELRPKSPAEAAKPAGSEKPAAKTGDTIRIASFNIQVFGSTKSGKSIVMDRLATIARQFDVLAVQQVLSNDQDIIPRFVERINAPGRRYDYVVGPRLGRSDATEQYAFLFDTETIEVDRNELWTVDDPDDLLAREPLVAWFRVRGPDVGEAFTFKLVNVRTDPATARQEVDWLDEVYRAVRDDGQAEDDIIVLGNFNVGHRELGELGAMPNMRAAVAGSPTETRGNVDAKPMDNLVFDQHSLSEFTGRSGVCDFMRDFNLTLEAALEISDHLPVWAEFSAHEGGQPGRVAAVPVAATE